MAYEDAYNVVVNSGGFINVAYNIEMSFKILSYISYKLTGSSILLFGTYAGLTNLFVLLGVYRFRKYISCSWAIYIYTSLLYFMMYNIGRQFLALAIVFAGTKEIVDRKPVKYLIYVLLATLFHSTAILTLFLYLYGFAASEQHKYRKLINMLLFLAPVVAMLGFNEILYMASLILDNDKYNSYSLGGGQSIGLGALVQLAMCLAVFVSYKKNKCNLSSERILNYSIRTYVLANVLFMLQYVMANYGGRIYLYFIPVEMILFGAILRGVSFNWRRLVLKANYVQVFSIAFSMFQAIYAIATNAQKHVPFAFRWF